MSESLGTPLGFLKLRRADTFDEHPSPAQLRAIKPGDWVKVASEKYGERFWVKVVKATNAQIQGRVDNHLLSVPLVMDEVVRFGKHHVVAILKAEDAPRKAAGT